jgi:glycosyltransferase involved in cell wall biosynthesis
MTAGADISIILNLHDETRYLRRTLQSLEEAVRFAKLEALHFELIGVLDRPTPSLMKWIATYDFSVFDLHRLVRVDHGSLGLSRNSGIDLATGTYICTADADDLISYNALREFYRTAQRNGPNTIVVPQYLLGFGASYCLEEYFGTDRISRLGFFGGHPYVSRIFAHRNIVEAIKYQDVSPDSGFAYEDWHFNCEAITREYQFVIARNVILFYRQRPNSLVASAESTSTRLIPMSNYFRPVNFVRICARDYERYLGRDVQRCHPHQMFEAFQRNPVCQEMIHAANRIDPAIDLPCFPGSPIGSNLDGNLDIGAAYFRLCQLVGSNEFTDVVFLPSSSADNAEQCIADVIGGLERLHPLRKFLVLTEDPSQANCWTERLPESAILVDLYTTCQSCSQEMLDILVLRLIQSVAPKAVLHLTNSNLSQSFFRKYARLLKENTNICYRFSDPVCFRDDLMFQRGIQFEFLSAVGDHLELIIADNEHLASRDRVKLDFLAGRFHRLYAKCPPLTHAEAIAARPGRWNRLLWASPLDSKHRPELLFALASRLKRRCPEVTIDIWGTPMVDGFDIGRFAQFDNLLYRGAYNVFRSLLPGKYDGFVYTTVSDGLPKVVLEALAAGLPVIAPDIGGIGEVVKTGETGILLENLCDDSATTNAYVEAITSLYADDVKRRGLSLGALNVIVQQHSEGTYLTRLAELFTLPSGAVDERGIKDTFIEKEGETIVESKSLQIKHLVEWNELLQQVQIGRCRSLHYAEQVSRLTPVEVELDSVKRSRFYRLWQKYQALYWLPIIGSPLRLARKVAGKMLKSSTH